MSITLIVAVAILLIIVFLQIRPGRAVSITLLLGIYLFYAFGTGTFRAQSFLLVTGYVIGPFAFGGLAGILWLWLPIEFRLLSAVDPIFLAPFAMCTGLLAYEKVRVNLRLTRKQAATAFQYFVLYAVIAIPLGYYIHFVRFDPNLSRIVRSPLLFAVIFLFNALPEEILFRGLLQDWLERQLKSATGALVVASIVFGAAHLNNGPPLPNYKYCLMAGVAGLAYGRVWKTQKSVVSSALTHALVNTTWQLFFR